MSKRARNAALRRRQLDRLVEHHRGIGARPKGGWLRDVRTALGMTGRQLAVRLGLSGSSAVAELERREQQDSITLRSLRNAANALGCELVYALVPHDANFEAMVVRHARLMAMRNVQQVSRQMQLEAQGVDSAVHNETIKEMTDMFVARLERRMWDIDHDD